jgi:hypothetical protein
MNSDLADIVKEIRAWNGSKDVALALRAKVKRLEEGAPGNDDAASLVMKICSAYKKHEPKKLYGALSVQATAQLCTPFIGDQEMGEWPFHDPERLDDEKILFWLRHLPPTTLATDDLRNFLQTAFLLRRRTLWVPASRSLGAMAVRDRDLESYLLDEWTACFPKGLTATWSSGQEKAGAHRRRHVLHAACVYCGHGGKALECVRLADFSLPNDAPEASVAVAALAELVRGPATRDRVLDGALKRVSEVHAGELQVDQSLRELVDAAADVPKARGLVDAALDQLVAPHWSSDVPGCVEPLFSWLDTAAWANGRGHSAALDKMRTAAGAATLALSWRIDGVHPSADIDPIDLLLPRIRILADPVMSATTSWLAKAIALAEVSCLLPEATTGDPDQTASPLPDWQRVLADFDWPRVVERATGRPPVDALEGKAGKMCRPQMLLWAGTWSHSGALQQSLAALSRDSILEECVVLQLARWRSGPVDIQVAVQMEQLLRTAPSSVEQVKLLWRLLREDPTSKVFTQLLDMLRGSGTPLHALVIQVKAMDDLRAEGPQAMGALAIAHSNLLAAARVLLGTPGGSEHEEADIIAALNAIGLAFAALDSHKQIGSEDWIEASRSAFEKLWHAMAKLDDKPDAATKRDRGDHEPRAENVRREHAHQVWAERWLDFETKLRNFVRGAANGDPRVGDYLRDELEKSRRGLCEALHGTSWPESALGKRLLDGLPAWIDLQVKKVAARDDVVRAIDECDEKRAVDYSEDQERLADLPADALRALGLFFLRRMLYWKAFKLRRAVKDRAQIPTPFSVLMPLLVAIPVGVLAIMNIGDQWMNGLLTADAWGRRAVVEVVALLLALALLITELNWRAPKGVAGLARASLAVIRRVLLTYGACLVMAGVSAWAMLKLVPARPAPACTYVQVWFLWTALTLGLGLFLGVLAQGQNLRRIEE